MKPEPLPRTPEDAELKAAAERAAAYRAYRKRTRPFRRAFRGIITRREAERFAVARIKRQVHAAMIAAQEANGD